MIRRLLRQISWEKCQELIEIWRNQGIEHELSTEDIVEKIPEEIRIFWAVMHWFGDSIHEYCGDEALDTPEFANDCQTQVLYFDLFQLLFDFFFIVSIVCFLPKKA